MAPYRSLHEDRRPAPQGPPPGPVADMVQQFADPYAFLRELVQNGMDAGARTIAVRVEALPGASATSVADDGAGMSRDDIEGPLLTLFSSSKEGDVGKIGKYGVGFVSVFAIQPEHVEVETWRDGKAYRLRLLGDTSYELEDAGPREGSGTRVTLFKQLTREAFVEHARRARAALRRWCRHAECEITLGIAGPDALARARVERIDGPLTVAAPVSVTSVEGDATLVVGPSAGAHRFAQHVSRDAAVEHGQSFAGFYNRGLTLFETADEVLSGLSGVRFKVMSPRLQHTLSRDNVRRDDAFWEALARVRELVKGPLRRELAARLAPAAAAAASAAAAGAGVAAGAGLARGAAGAGVAAVARGAGGVAVAASAAVAEYVALLEAALTPPTALDPDEIPFPLANPLAGDRARAGLRSLAPGREPLLVAQRPDALTEAVTQGGLPVVLCCHPAVLSLLTQCFPLARIEEVRAAYLLVREAPESASEGDAALLTVVAEALARARHAVAGVRLCQIDGALRQRSAILLPARAQAAGGPGRSCHAARDVARCAARWRPGYTLYLNVESDAVALARRRAALDAVTAGNLLARALLVEARGPLDPDDSDRLLDVAARPPPPAGAAPGAKAPPGAAPGAKAPASSARGAKAPPGAAPGAKAPASSARGAGDLHGAPGAPQGLPR
ncbi:ATP-binding protein [Sorangium sp. So ce1036]|uniref:sacsin N-terminal ATP-binding-like domain-containing protein n=1 Tax=Sorangium sp. So ce1036 TaxID=3133328 RepID=UPI003F11EC31